jgi:hypothetical protein
MDNKDKGLDTELEAVAGPSSWKGGGKSNPYISTV